MNKKRTVDRIIELFSRFRAEVELYNSSSLFDINIYAESILIPILNHTYGLDLNDANFNEKNFSAVDLIDTDARVAFQVTSTEGGEKVKHTLTTYIKDKRYENFDSIFVYVLKKKQSKYSDKTFEQIIDGKFDFNSKENIIDSSDIVNIIKSWISLPRIQKVLELLEEQFTEDSIESRKYHIENQEITDSQILFPNLLEITFPKYIYVGQLGIERDKIIKQSWETKYRLKWTASARQVIKSKLYSLRVIPTNDWVDFDGTLISFRDLSDNDEPLSNIVEQGTVEKFKVKEYFRTNEKYENAFRNLLSVCFTQMLSQKDISWLPKDKLYRFKATKLLNDRQLEWKNRKKAKRTIVKQIWNKEKNLIIAFRHLAFKLGVFLEDDVWYVSVTPEYSITKDGWANHGGARTFITSQKKLDKNQSVYLHFMFISYCLRNKIMESEPDYQYIAVNEPMPLKLTFRKYL